MQILLALAEELGGFTPLIGGPAYAHILLKPLENLAAIEETVVREKAVQALHTIGEELPPVNVDRDFIPLVKVCFQRLLLHDIRKTASSSMQSVAQVQGYNSRQNLSLLYCAVARSHVKIHTLLNLTHKTTHSAMPQARAVETQAGFTPNSRRLHRAQQEADLKSVAICITYMRRDAGCCEVDELKSGISAHQTVCRPQA